MGKKPMSTSGPVSSSVKQDSSITWPPEPHFASSVTYKLSLLGVGLSIILLSMIYEVSVHKPKWLRWINVCTTTDMLRI